MLTTLLVIIIILLFILVLAIKPARQLFRGAIGLFVVGFFIIVGFFVFLFTVSINLNLLQHSLITQVHWWAELFVGIY